MERLKVHGLPPLSFEVRTGECLAIEGRSGSGKSLLLRAIADLDPAQGYVFLEGLERREIAAPDWRQRVRFAAAEPGWWADTPRPHFSDISRVLGLLASLGLEPEIFDRPIAQLSTGERQRLALARAVADEPSVLLFDEPTSALDPPNAALAEELIRSQLVSGRSLVLVSHDRGQRERLAHACLQLGKVTADGSVREGTA